MHKVISTKPLENHKLWIQFETGEEGIVDLSELVGKGVFAPWQDEAFFNQVSVGEHGELVWDDVIDLCPDSLYLKLEKN